MTTVRRTVTALLLVSLSLACSTTLPSDEELAAADIGPYPEDFADQIARYLAEEHSDPSKIHDLTATEPVRGYHDFGVGLVEIGWKSLVTFRGEDRQGRPGALREMVAMFRDGRLLFVRRGR